MPLAPSMLQIAAMAAASATAAVAGRMGRIVWNEAIALAAVIASAYGMTCAYGGGGLGGFDCGDEGYADDEPGGDDAGGGGGA